MIIEKFFEKGGIDYKGSKLTINSIYSLKENLHYNISIKIDTDKNLCFVTCERPDFFINIPGLRESIPKTEDVVEKYVETYKPMFFLPEKKRVMKSIVELKKREKISYVSNCFTLVER
jgi:hypothetical protein